MVSSSEYLESLWGEDRRYAHVCLGLITGFRVLSRLVGETVL